MLNLIDSFKMIYRSKLNFAIIIKFKMVLEVLCFYSIKFIDVYIDLSNDIVFYNNFNSQSHIMGLACPFTCS